MMHQVINPFKIDNCTWNYNLFKNCKISEPDFERLKLQKNGNDQVGIEVRKRFLVHVPN